MSSIYSVAQVNNYIKNMISTDFALKNIYIKGEVSNCKYHSNGHIYFSLKDKGGVIKATMFKNYRSGLNFQMEDGQTVIVFGAVDVYVQGGTYQILAKQVTLEGAGLLYQKFEQLKNELNEMGLFDPMYKKPIPKFALKVGICTAQTGAAIQDIINISTRRNPYVQLYLYPSLVQGGEAAKDIVNGIRTLDDMGLDVIIVGRGGGSIEDLWAFNEEIVARAIFDCETPIISAVGHETDTTIADYVADMRAPTPSAAAELAVFDYAAFKNNQMRAIQMLNSAMLSSISKYRTRLENYETKLELYSPNNQLLNKKQYISDLQIKLEDEFNRILNERKHKLEVFATRLEGLSPLGRISKGYAYVTAKDKPITSVKDISINDEINLTISDGKVNAVVSNVECLNK